MRIKLLQRLAGPEGNYPSGTVLTIEDKKALPLINGGYAVSLEPIEIEVKTEKVKPKERPKTAKSKPKNKKAVSK